MSPQSSAAQARARANPFAGRKVLVVDDDRASIKLVREGLSNAGYEFAEAYDGSTALSMIRDLKPDLVLLDVEMPALNGVEVCRIVKAHQSEEAFGFIPVILMTARQSARKVEGLELGADDYLIKPVDMLELSARVHSMLRLKALQDELVAKCHELDRTNHDLVKKSHELEQLSRIDPLTGLFNRRYFEERFRAEYARSARYRVPMSCLMLDADHFKKINDRLGHLAGDEALRSLAAILRRTLRDVDLSARWGGEELVAVLPETDMPEGARAAERIREAVAAFDFEHEGRHFDMTVSLGVASFPAPGIGDAEALLRCADEALYQAKAQGRDRVVVHEDSRS